MDPEPKRRVSNKNKRRNSSSKTPSKAKYHEETDSNVTDWINSTFFSEESSPKNRRPPKKKHARKVSASEVSVKVSPDVNSEETFHNELNKKLKQNALSTPSKGISKKVSKCCAVLYCKM